MQCSNQLSNNVVFFTWNNRLHVEDLGIVQLHLHVLFVQHSNIIPKHTKDFKSTPQWLFSQP